MTETQDKIVMGIIAILAATTVFLTSFAWMIHG
jgi:hypothetical protein